MKISSPFTVPIPWRSVDDISRDLNVGDWLDATLENRNLVNASYYPPLGLVSGRQIAVDGVLKVMQPGPWGITSSTVNLATGGTTLRHITPTTSQRALILLALLETYGVSGADEGEVESVKERLVERLTLADGREYRKYVVQSQTEKQVEVEGLGVMANEVVVLQGGKWWTASGSEVTAPPESAVWA